jgi:signal peptidase I
VDVFKRNALGMHWVGDLAVEATVEVKGPQGKVLLDLVEGGVHFNAAIDVATGEAKLTIAGRPDFQHTAKTSLVGPGTYDVRFSNADDELLLWVNGSLVKFDAPTTYPPLNNDIPISTPEDPGDLAPVGIGSQGVALNVSRARVLRDIYYIADRVGRRPGNFITEYEYGSPLLNLHSAEAAIEFFSNPQSWVDSQGRSVFNDRMIEKFELRKDTVSPGLDQFFALGDNSPASADSRLWADDHEIHPYVERELLIGKALYIYWPHAWPTKYNVRIPGTEVRVPFIPNFKRMRFIR